MLDFQKESKYKKEGRERGNREKGKRERLNETHSLTVPDVFDGPRTRPSEVISATMGSMNCQHALSFP